MPRASPVAAVSTTNTAFHAVCIPTRYIHHTVRTITVLLLLSPSCGIYAPQQPLLRSILSRSTETFNPLYSSLRDQFELCLSKCRTSSLVRHTYIPTVLCACFLSQLGEPIFACFSERQTRKHLSQSQNKVLLWSRFHYHPPRHEVFNPPSPSLSSLHLSVSVCLSCLGVPTLTPETSISVFLPCTDQRMMQCKSESQCVQLQGQKMHSSQHS